MPSKPTEKPSDKTNDKVRAASRRRAKASAAARQITDVPYRHQPTEAAAGQYHYLGFLVELLVDDQHRVRLTQALHVKSNEGRAWTGWDEKRLLNFFQQHVKDFAPERFDLLAQPSAVEHNGQNDSLAASSVTTVAETGWPTVIPATLTAETAASESPWREGAAPENVMPRGRLRQKVATLTGVNMFQTAAPAAEKSGGRADHFTAPSGGMSKRMQRRLAAFMPEVSSLMASSASRPVSSLQDSPPEPSMNEPALLIRTGESFDAPMPAGSQAFEGVFDTLKGQGQINYRYTATIYAKRCEDNARLLLSQQQGALTEPGQKIAIKVLGKELSRGLYRLHSSLAVTAQPAGKETAPITHMALQSSLLQVV